MTTSPTPPAAARVDRNKRDMPKPAWRTPVLRQVQLPLATLENPNNSGDAAELS
ncbi:hypothetical protein [Ancylobacter vacuolatus]|uniref:Uncharacterized protein n=1 Tax=Ancylobacter vacuolatus TaxID=223389 RepID=A0ABU0DG68_9HYPH|nr:hypothetical protein [Ancylobacter vacuolatus]MDQ0347429.1 hypothetical protein [Ancylobacter vacuolatus]